jgi:SAM-dependent methyltransferase
MAAVGFDPVYALETDERSLSLMASLPDVAPVESLDAIENGTLGLVTMSHVLEHMDEPIGLLRRLAAKLRPDGVLFIEVPNEGMMVRDDALRTQQRVINFGHLFHYDSQTLAALFGRVPELQLLTVDQDGRPVESWIAQTGCDPMASVPGQKVWLRSVLKRRA